MKTLKNIEFETKVLNINSQEIINNLRKLGAKESPEFLAKRFVFDLTGDKFIEWIRLRQINGKSTITYKRKNFGNTKVGKTIEIEVEVTDFDKTAQILSKIPFKAVYYEENKTHVFTLNGIEFSIDSWPHIPPYLEIEGKNKAEVAKGLKLLNLTDLDVGGKDIKEIYQENGLDIHSFKKLQF